MFHVFLVALYASVAYGSKQSSFPQWKSSANSLKLGTRGVRKILPLNSNGWSSAEVPLVGVVTFYRQPNQHYPLCGSMKGSALLVMHIGADVSYNLWTDPC